MDAKQLNFLLIKKFPQLKKRYHEEVDWQEGDETGSHIVYGDVFSPYMEKMIEIDDIENLKDIFTFIESLLMLKDDYAEEVIMLSVLERLSIRWLQEHSSLINKSTFNALKSMGILQET